MCIRDSFKPHIVKDRSGPGDGHVFCRIGGNGDGAVNRLRTCLLYTSDAADERSSVDLGGRRIINKTTNEHLGQ